MTTATSIKAIRTNEICSLTHIAGDIYRLDSGSFEGSRVRISGDLALLLADDDSDWIGSDGHSLTWAIVTA